MAQDPYACPEYADDNVLIFNGLRVRMGLNTGKAFCTQDIVSGRMDYFGRAVTRAAKVTGMAQGGEILVTQNTYEVMLILVGLGVW